MRKTLSIGIGIGTAAAAMTISMAAGVASATSGGHRQAASSTAVAAAVNKHITRAQARHIALAKVPHSRVIEIESDDLHDRAIWKVTLATSHGRVVVAVDKRTGQATILRGRSGGGHGLAASARSLGLSGRTASDDRGTRIVADERDRDGRNHDGGRDDRRDRHDHDQFEDAAVR